MSRNFKILPSTVHERFGEETVILNLDTGTYYSTQEVGSALWDLIVKGAGENDILRHASTAFSGDDGEIARESSAFLDRLIEESLVKAVPPGESGKSDESIAGDGNGASKLAFSVPVLHKYTDMEEMLLLDPIHEVDDAGWPTTRRLED